jgi:predicted metal-binding membrane protein
MLSAPNHPTLHDSNTPVRFSEQPAFVWSLGSLIALAWLALWLWDRSPYGRYLDHGQLGDLGADGTPFSIVFPVTLYLIGWTLMTVAMMLPTVLPLLAIFRRLTSDRPERAQLLALVICGYIGVWTAFGAMAHIADWLLHQVVERVAWLDSHAWVIGATTLLLAGAFQFSALKYRCLDKCRAPLSFVMGHWRGRHDFWHAFRLGINHGKFCVGCCWALMLLMFGVGVGNIGWMLALAAIMAIEKNLPWGRKISAPLGVALLCWGGFIFLSQLRA